MIRIKLACGLLYACSLIGTANASLTYEFLANGFEGGGTLIGSFTGHDRDPYGEYTKKELSEFEVTFYESNIKIASWGLDDLNGFGYDWENDFIWFEATYYTQGGRWYNVNVDNEYMVYEYPYPFIEELVGVASVNIPNRTVMMGDEVWVKINAPLLVDDNIGTVPAPPVFVLLTIGIASLAAARKKVQQ